MLTFVTIFKKNDFIEIRYTLYICNRVTYRRLSMEINKITFDEAKYGAAFETLDVNNDGKITKDDLSLATDNKVKSQLQSVLNDADDDVVLEKAGAKKNKYGVNQTDASNFDNDVTKSKGTVYVVMGNIPGCGRCVSLEKELQKKLSDVEAKAQVFNMQWNDNSDKCRDIYHSVAKNKGSIGFPVVVKFVDGKPVELISEGSANYSKVVQTMIDKAEGTKETGSTEAADTTGQPDAAATTEKTASTTTTSAKTAEHIT